MVYYKSKHLKLLAALVFIVALVMISRLSGLSDNFTVERLHLIFEQHWLSAGLIFIGLFVLGNLLNIPGWIFLLTAVLALGKVFGGLLTYIAAIVSTIASFYIVRSIGGDALRQINYAWVQRLLTLIDQRPLRVQILLRLVFQTAPPLNYTLALSGLQIGHYILGAIIGLPLPITLYVLFFDQLFEWLM